MTQNKGVVGVNRISTGTPTVDTSAHAWHTAIPDKEVSQ